MAATAVVAIVCALVLARPYDGALNRSAASGTQWTDHLVRVETALVRRNGGDWITAADQGYPPLIHWVAAPLGSVLGHHAGIVERAGLLWLLLLVAATGGLATAITEDRTTGALAAATVATFPALHGTALGYFYDLPMTALLFAAAAALFAYGTTRPVVAGISAGVFFVLACTGKWTALVLAPFLVLPALLNKRDGGRPWLATGIAAAVAAGGVAGVLAISSKSLQAMAGTGYGVQQAGQADPEATLYRILFYSGGPLREALEFLPIRTVLGALGPALAIVVFAAIAVWAVRSRAGAMLVASVLIGDVFIIHRFFPALNDRWLISMVPVLAIAAAAGVRSLPKGREVAALVLLAVGLAGTWDFHHGEAHARAAIAQGGDNADWNQLRGWGAASSTEPQFGWARADYRAGIFLANREAIWDAIVRCGATDVYIEGAVSSSGDAPWWRYRDTLHQLETDAAAHHIASLDGTELTSVPAAGEASAVALLRADRRDLAGVDVLLPGWRLRAQVPAWGDAPAVGLWTPARAATCSAFDRQRR